MTVRPARLHRATAASALVLLLPLAACAGTDAAGTASAGSSAPAGPSASEDAPEEELPEDAGPPVEESQRITVEVTGGQVSGDTGRVPVAVGAKVTLVITSDAADSAHVHGYDLTADLAPGTPAEISFTATIPGIFEVELHEAGTALLALQVS